MTEVKYDLDLNSKPCRGVLRYENGAVYALEDGSAVERVDTDTFRIIGSGALVTVVRE